MPALLLLTMLMLLGGCSTKPYSIDSPGPSDGQGKHAVYIVSHGWHSGIVIDAQQALTKLPGLRNRFSNAEKIEFGWGDEGFYQAGEVTSGLTLKALFWPTATVMHAVAVPRNVSAYFSSSEVRRLCLSDSGLLSLISFIGSSFERSSSGQLLPLNQGLYGDSQFYTGVGTFHFMNTCNKWTAKALKSAGMDINPAFKLTSDSIMRTIESYNQQQGSASRLAASPCQNPAQ
jgi:uncharacterized protein (TIGR02117 family)